MKKNSHTQLLKITAALAKKVRLIVLFVFLIWLGYIFLFIYQNLAPIFINPEAITLDLLIKQQSSINQQAKEEVFRSLEDKVKSPSALPNETRDPFF